MKIVIICMVLILLSGCFSQEEDLTKFNLYDMKECSKINGTYEKVGRAQVYTCNKNTIDSGKMCLDSNECEGLCILENNIGKCSSKTENFGCIPILENGTEVTICID